MIPPNKNQISFSFDIFLMYIYIHITKINQCDNKIINSLQKVGNMLALYMYLFMTSMTVR